MGICYTHNHVRCAPEVPEDGTTRGTATLTLPTDRQLSGFLQASSLHALLSPTLLDVAVVFQGYSGFLFAYGHRRKRTLALPLEVLLAPSGPNPTIQGGKAGGGPGLLISMCCIPWGMQVSLVPWLLPPM